jgi:hypothetical protein
VEKVLPFRCLWYDLTFIAPYVPFAPKRVDPLGVDDGLEVPGLLAGPFLLVRPAGRTYLEVEVLYSPGKGKS